MLDAVDNYFPVASARACEPTLHHAQLLCSELFSEKVPVASTLHRTMKYHAFLSALASPCHSHLKAVVLLPPNYYFLLLICRHLLLSLALGTNKDITPQQIQCIEPPKVPKCIQVSTFANLGGQVVREAEETYSFI